MSLVLQKHDLFLTLTKWFLCLNNNIIIIIMMIQFHHILGLQNSTLPTLIPVIQLNIQKWSTLCNDMNVDSSLPFLSEHTSVVLTSSCSSPLHFSVRVDSCLIRAAAVTTSSSFMSLLFTEYQTNMAVLFLNTCQYFHSFCLSGGSCALIYDEELLTIFILF